MNILQLKTNASRGGAETLVLLLSQQLERRGHKVVTVVGESGWLVEQLRAKELSVEVCPMTSVWSMLAFPKLARIALQYKPDIILGHGARANMFACMVSILTKRPLVTVEHSVDPWRDESGLLNLLDQGIGRVSCQRIAVSRAVEAKLLEKAILPKEKLVHIPNGFGLSSLADPSAVRDRIRRDLGLKDADVVLVMVARFVDAKGHHILINALPAILARVPRVRLLLLGDGPLFEKVRRQTQAAGLRECVVMPGAVDNIPEKLAACDLFVLPSLWEGLPVALLEAMGSGLPVVASAVGGIPEVVESGKTGMLVPPDNHERLAETVCYLLQNENLRTDLARAGRDYVIKHHRIEVMTDRYLEMMQSCISK